MHSEKGLCPGTSELCAQYRLSVQGQKPSLQVEVWSEVFTGLIKTNQDPRHFPLSLLRGLAWVVWRSWGWYSHDKSH